MRVGFAGTPSFASRALARIADAGFAVPLALTQPDRPAGRGMKLAASPVKQLALERGIAVVQPRSLRQDGRYPHDAVAATARVAEAALDVLVVAAYGLILPRWLLETPRRGCINIHASLLPRWRGAAPVQRAIEAGDPVTGVTIMQMDEGLDTGAMIAARETPISPDDTAGSLTDRLADIGAELIVDVLARLREGAIDARPQPADGATYAAKIAKAEAAVDWREPAAVLERRVRAFDPFPGASFDLDGETIKLWRGRVHADKASAAPGTVIGATSAGFAVACGDSVLEVTEIQRPGGRRQPASAFAAGHPGLVGRVLVRAA